MFVENVSWKPTDIATSGDRGSAWTIAYDNENSTSVDVYWLTLKFTDDGAGNYAWDPKDLLTFIEGTVDHIQEDGSVRLWYRITLRQFDVELSIDEAEGWTYGDAEKSLSYKNPAQVPEDEITFLYTGTTANGEEYSDSKQPTEAGFYELTITIPQYGDYDYGTGKTNVSFTILPKLLTVSGWNGTEADYGKAGNASVTFTGAPRRILSRIRRPPRARGRIHRHRNARQQKLLYKRQRRRLRVYDEQRLYHQ